MAKKTAKGGLGRGLDALFAPDEDGASAVMPRAGRESVIEVPLSLIDVNRSQPRKDFDEEALEELASSIRSVGILQPIIACEENGRYRIIAGERRFRAAHKAGLEKVPVIVRDYDEQRRMEAALVENLQRSDLNPVEEAEGIRALMDEASLTQDEAAARLGMSRPALANTLRLLTLPDAVRDMLRSGSLSAGHARALVPLERTRQVQLANLAVAQHWSVRQLERVCAASVPEKKPPKPPRDAQIARLESMAREVFGTRVRIDGTQEEGKLTISYFSRDDLERIWEILAAVGKDPS